MDLLMTMFKPKTSMSPVKDHHNSSSLTSGGGASATKRKHDPSPTRHNGAGKSSMKKAKKEPVEVGEQGGEPKFTFDEVKTMIDSLLSQNSKAASVASSAGLKQVDFHEVCVPGHSAEACRGLVEKLIRMTRRVRTLNEVLTDIRDNLSRRAYTAAIMRATLDKQPPKKPPSAYLLYHKERYETLRDEVSQASEIAKIVSDEWKKMEDSERARYFKRHNDLVKKYEKEFKKCGLVRRAQKPKRARSAKALFAKSKIDELAEERELEKEEISRLKEQYLREYEDLDKESKAHWVRQYQLEQDRFRREKDEYIAANPHLDHQVPERVRPPRYAIKPPMPPKSALKFFLAKKLPEGLEGEHLDAVKQNLREKFAKMSDKKALKYIKKAIKDKERYDAEMDEFKAAHPEAAVPNLKANVSKDQWKIYATLVENKPVPPAPTAYLHFCGKALSDCDYENGQVPTQRMQSASVAWSSLSWQEKVDVEREHVAAIKGFLEEMETWLLNQSEKRRDQVYKDEPRCRPEYWRKRLARMERNLVKQEQEQG